MKFKGKRQILFVVGGILIIFSISAFQKKGSQETTKASLSKSSEILKKVGDDYWKYMLEESLSLRMKHGLKINELPDVSFQEAKSDSAFAESILERLKEVKIEELNHEEWISLEILKWGAKNTIEGLKFYWLGFPVTPYASPIPGANRAFTTYQFKEKRDLDQYLNLLKKYPAFTNDIQNKMREQYNKGIILPKEEIDIVISFLGYFIKEGEKSLFYVGDKRLDKFKASEVKGFQQKLVEIINSEVNPALENLVGFIRGDYLKKAPDSVGLWQYPEGKEYYKYLVRVQTTLALSPEEIHQIGLENIKKNKEKVEEIKKSLGFKGTMAEFRHFLKTDSRFFPKTPEEIGEKLITYANAMSLKLDSYFLRKPKAPYGVKRLAPELEGSQTFGYYQSPTASDPKGCYNFNGSKLDERSLLWAEGLIYHELIPGHHFHSCLQSENEELPNFRRDTAHYTAFSEGWAEYASWLGVDMGLYQEPYSLCGKYMNDMFLTSRLVVDTGMNYFEWPRSQAVKFMKDNLAESDTQIHSETLRYSVDMPGQALGYKLGSLKMFELREKAKKALGDKFDIRKLNMAFVGSSAMPLPILEQHIDWFIKKEQDASKK